MSEALILILALLAGVLIGVFFFGGLWWTIQRSIVSTQPAVLVVGSFLLRILVTVMGFYLALQDGWQSLVACLGGFLVARIAVTRIIAMPRNKTAKPPRRHTL